jgi:hypothetical protein
MDEDILNQEINDQINSGEQFYETQDPTSDETAITKGKTVKIDIGLDAEWYNKGAISYQQPLKRTGHMRKLRRSNI